MAAINTFINAPLKQTIITVIRMYRFAISLLLGHCCRFELSCSNYAIEAIQIHGCLKGCYYTMRRLLRCHPWHPGGHDPVPLTSNNRSELC